MGRLAQFLDQSRTARLIEQVEQGEAVDVRRVLALQALDVARVGELFVLDAIEAEEEADAECERLAGE